MHVGFYIFRHLEEDKRTSYMITLLKNSAKLTNQESFQEKSSKMWQFRRLQTTNQKNGSEHKTYLLALNLWRAMPFYTVSKHKTGSQKKEVHFPFFWWRIQICDVKPQKNPNGCCHTLLSPEGQQSYPYRNFPFFFFFFKEPKKRQRKKNGSDTER